MFKATEDPYVLPLPDINGIYQSDLIIETAIKEGLRRLRQEDSWKLKYVFAGLVQDPLTRKQYGQKDIDQMIKWFLATDIPCFINTRIDTYLPTSISIALIASSEVENTLADVHYVPYENIPAPQSETAYVGPFTPGYNINTGVVTLPYPLTTDLFYENMWLVNKNGQSYQIVEVLDDTTLQINIGPNIDLNHVELRANPLHKEQAFVGSAQFRETFTIGVHEPTDPYHCLALSCILQFILLAYRKELFEQRGLERTKISLSDFIKEGSIEGEISYKRYFTLEAYTRSYWPVSRWPIAQSVVFEPTFAPAEIDSKPSFQD